MFDTEFEENLHSDTYAQCRQSLGSSFRNDGRRADTRDPVHTGSEGADARNYQPIGKKGIINARADLHTRADSHQRTFGRTEIA